MPLPSFRERYLQSQREAVEEMTKNLQKQREEREEKEMKKREASQKKKDEKAEKMRKFNSLALISRDGDDGDDGAAAAGESDVGGESKAAARRPSPVRTASTQSMIKFDTSHTYPGNSSSIPKPTFNPFRRLPENTRPTLGRSSTSQGLSGFRTNSFLSKLSRSTSSKATVGQDLSPDKSSAESNVTSSPATPRSILGLSRNSSFSPFRSTKTSQKASGPDTPGLTAMLQRELGKDVPDLEAVNRALEQLKLAPGNQQEKVAYIDSLTKVAAKLEDSRKDCKKRLTEAMKYRDEGKTEMCRAMCVQIIHNKAADASTKVQAYNILAMQASPGQAKHFLNESEKLVKQAMRDDPEYQQLLGVIALLRERGREQERKHSDHITAAGTGSSW